MHGIIKFILIRYGKNKFIFLVRLQQKKEVFIINLIVFLLYIVLFNWKKKYAKNNATK